MTLPEHAVCSVMLAQFTVRQKYGWHGVLAVLGAGLAPDLDVISKLFGDQYFWEYHHALGHCVPAVLLIAGVFGFIGSRKSSSGSFGDLFLWCLGAACTHVVTDMLYWFAVKPLWPSATGKSPGA
jgi:membrane-bound metal-dependent hydrolase YbcI (DUF457 family)